MAEIESIVEPYCVLNDFRRKTISLINICIIHPAIVAEEQLTCQYPQITEVATKDQVEGARLSIFGSMVCPHCRLRQTKAKKCTGCGESVLKAVAKKSFTAVVENPSYMNDDPDQDNSPGKFAFLPKLLLNCIQK